MKIDLDLFEKYVTDKLITKQQHPDAPLYIFNYTPVCQFGRSWDDVTLMCRGLITDLDGNIMARPFKKFFNVEEHQGEIPQEPFTVLEKLDGSLGILYYIDGEPYLATRGSFTSDQAIEGTKILRERYGDLSDLDKTCTYLFEIIYPENRIVVDYGQKRDVVLLAKIDTETGREASIESYRERFSVARLYDGINDLESLRMLENSDDEGFVVTFASGLKLKLKFQEYVRLHRLLTQVSSKSIWEVLKNGDPLNDVLDRVPDEFYQWVRETERKLRAKHDEAIATATAVYDKVDKTDRKAAALSMQGKDSTTRAIVFALLDGKTETVEKIAWQYARPTYEKPFKQDIDA